MVGWYPQIDIPSPQGSTGAISTAQVTIGMQIEAELAGDDTTMFQYLEIMYVTIYCIELGLRFFAHHLACLRNNWVRFDLFLVVASLFALIVEPMMKGALGGFGA